MDGVHSHGKGRASVGLISPIWVMGTKLTHLDVVSHRLKLYHAPPYGAMTVLLALR